MKIGVYSFFSFPHQHGGRTTRMKNILKYLSKSNEVIVYSPGGTKEDTTETSTLKTDEGTSITIKHFNFKLNYWKIYNDYKVYQFLKKEYQKGSFDILQLESSSGAFFLMTKCNFPMVGVFHGRGLKEMAYSAKLLFSQGKIFKSVALYLFRVYLYLCSSMSVKKSDHLIAMDTHTKDYAISLGGNPEKISILTNGFDMKEYLTYSTLFSKIELRKTLKIPKEAFVFIFHGRLSWDQNLEAVKQIIKIKNWLKQHDTTRNYYFVIVGGPVKEINKISKDSTRDSDILFTGYVEDVKPYLFAADCGLAPYPEDAQPGGPRLKIIEFLASGLPVITTNTGISGYEELIDEQPIYLLGENFKDLIRWMSDFPTRSQREKLEKFNWSKIASQNEEILREVLERSS